jgi:hypothetical protein
MVFDSSFLLLSCIRKKMLNELISHFSEIVAVAHFDSTCMLLGHSGGDFNASNKLV